jgi:hypothetical protein
MLFKAMRLRKKRKWYSQKEERTDEEVQVSSTHRYFKEGCPGRQSVEKLRLLAPSHVLTK